MSSSTPLVSVYITTFNRKELLSRAVESVRKQSYPHVEIIVADDGSTDGTHEYLLALEQAGVLKTTINQSGESKGACFGRNNAIALAAGHFVTGLDDDDYFEDWRIEKFVERWKLLEANGQLEGVAGLFDSVTEIRADGNHKYYEQGSTDYATLRKANNLGNQVFTTKAHFVEVGCFDEKMPALQDWDTWIRLANRFGKFINCQSYSYIIDQVHGEVRISEKKAARIRNAFALLSNKLQPMSYSEKVAHLDAMYSYKQIDVTFADLAFLLVSGKVRRVAQVVKRKLISA